MRRQNDGCRRVFTGPVDLAPGSISYLLGLINDDTKINFTAIGASNETGTGCWTPIIAHVYRHIMSIHVCM